MAKKNNACPVEKKVLLTIDEASEYFGISKFALRNATKVEGCPFAFWSGRRLFVKREELEQFIKENKTL
jgi:excisionase family DNA binding protein